MYELSINVNKDFFNPFIQSLGIAKTCSTYLITMALYLEGKAIK